MDHDEIREHISAAASGSDGLVRRMRAELEHGDQAVVIATGGLADVLSGESVSIQHVDPNLTLDGLRLIWERSH